MLDFGFSLIPLLTVSAIAAQERTQEEVQNQESEDSEDEDFTGEEEQQDDLESDIAKRGVDRGTGDNGRNIQETNNQNAKEDTKEQVTFYPLKKETF